MHRNPAKRQLNSFFGYLPRTFKFHQLKHEGLPPFMFLLLLGIHWAANVLIPQGNIDEVGEAETIKQWIDVLKDLSWSIFLTMAVNVVIVLVASVYLVAYLKELKQEKSSLGNCIKTVFQKGLRLIMVNMFFYAGLTFGIISQLPDAPALVMGGFLSLVFLPILLSAMLFFLRDGFFLIFGSWFVVDKQTDFIQAMSSSFKIMAGQRRKLLSLLVGYTLLFLLLVSLLEGMFGLSGSNAIIYFVDAFIQSVITLMQIRLITLIYMDLVYGREEAEQA